MGCAVSSTTRGGERAPKRTRRAWAASSSGSSASSDGSPGRRPARAAAAAADDDTNGAGCRPLHNGGAARRAGVYGAPSGDEVSQSHSDCRSCAQSTGFVTKERPLVWALKKRAMAWRARVTDDGQDHADTHERAREREAAAAMDAWTQQRIEIYTMDVVREALRAHLAASAPQLLDDSLGYSLVSITNQCGGSAADGGGTASGTQLAQFSPVGGEDGGDGGGGGGGTTVSPRERCAPAVEPVEHGHPAAADAPDLGSLFDLPRMRRLLARHARELDRGSSSVLSRSAHRSRCGDANYSHTSCTAAAVVAAAPLERRVEGRGDAAVALSPLSATLPAGLRSDARWGAVSGEADRSRNAGAAALDVPLINLLHPDNEVSCEADDYVSSHEPPYWAAGGDQRCCWADYDDDGDEEENPPTRPQPVASAGRCGGGDHTSGSGSRSGGGNGSRSMMPAASTECAGELDQSRATFSPLLSPRPAHAVFTPPATAVTAAAPAATSVPPLSPAAESTARQAHREGNGEDEAPAAIADAAGQGKEQPPPLPAAVSLTEAALQWHRATLAAHLRAHRAELLAPLLLPGPPSPNGSGNNHRKVENVEKEKEKEKEKETRVADADAVLTLRWVVDGPPLQRLQDQRLERIVAEQRIPVIGHALLQGTWL